MGRKLSRISPESSRIPPESSRHTQHHTECVTVTSVIYRPHEISNSRMVRATLIQPVPESSRTVTQWRNRQFTMNEADNCESVDIRNCSWHTPETTKVTCGGTVKIQAVLSGGMISNSKTSVSAVMCDNICHSGHMSHFTQDRLVTTSTWLDTGDWIHMSDIKQGFEFDPDT